MDEGGLGFNMKWNMGWANDFYEYVSTDPLYRKYNHTALNFPIMYAFTENYCLPISHDEVVHGKKSFVDKMFGDYEDKFSQMRASLLLMMTYPGKKLMFMGTEYAQFREWDFDNSLEWFMLDYEKHREMQEYVRELNSFYLSRSELWDRDFTPLGFSWILPDESDKNTVAYRRINNKNESIVVAINFSGADQTLRLPLMKSRHLVQLFATDAGINNAPIPVSSENGEYYADVTLPRFSGVVFKERSLIKKAKSECDYVFILVHCHANDLVNHANPPAFLEEFCKDCIDNGVSAIFGGGCHQLRKIELYKNKPIFFSLGDFIYQGPQVEKLPADFMLKNNCDINLSAKEALNVRSQNGKIGLHTCKDNYLSVLPSLTFDGETLVEFKLLPVELNFDSKNLLNGLPKIAKEEDTLEILNVLNSLSTSNQKFKLENGFIVLE